MVMEGTFQDELGGLPGRNLAAKSARIHAYALQSGGMSHLRQSRALAEQSHTARAM